MRLGRLSAIALAAIVAAAGTGFAIAELTTADDDPDTPREIELRKDDGAGEEVVTDEDGDDDTGDGDRTPGDDGTSRGNNTGDGDDTRGDDGTRGGDNTRDRDRTGDDRTGGDD